MRINMRGTEEGRAFARDDIRHQAREAHTGNNPSGHHELEVPSCETGNG